MKGSGKKIAGIIVGLLVSVGLLFGGFMAVTQFTRASDDRPQEIVISAITGSSATIAWTTSSEVSGGVVQYGVSPTALTSFAPEESEKTKNHAVDLTLLTPNTTYYFEITYGTEKKYDNGGTPWTFSTKDGSAATEQSSVSPTPTPTTTATQATPTGTTRLDCSETDCDAIKAKLGKGCSTQEYIKCIKAEENPSPAN